MQFEVKLLADGSLWFTSAHAAGRVTCDTVETLSELAARVNDETPAAIRDRCYSLVQSIATAPFGESGSARLDVYENEAYQIAKDAGWLK